MRRLVIGLGAVVVLLAGCSSATNDRTSGAGKNPDSSEDVWNVKIFNNADSVPNIALFCINKAAPMAIMSTLSGGDSGKDKAAQLVPLPALDIPYCGAKPK